MFTIDFFTAPGTLPIKSVVAECELISEAVEAGRRLLDTVPTAAGFVVSGDLNEVVYSTFDTPAEENLA